MVYKPPQQQQHSLGPLECYVDAFESDVSFFTILLTLFLDALQLIDAAFKEL